MRYQKQLDYHVSDRKSMKYFAQATGSFTEQVFALAILDVPYKNRAEISSNFMPEENKVKISASTPALVFHRNLKVIYPFCKGVVNVSSLMHLFRSFTKSLPIKKGYWLFRISSIPQNMTNLAKYKSFLITI